MKLRIIFAFFSIGLLAQCKDSIEIKPKIEQIFAENEYDFGGNIKLNIFSDSTYTFTVIEKNFNYEKIEIFSGFCFKKHDTIYFKPFEFKSNGSEKAVIKNGFIEFVDGKSPLKIEIKKNAYHTQSNLDFTNFIDYAVFTFDPKFYSSIHYKYQPNMVNAYDLQQSELVEVDNILKKCFLENSSKLMNINEYVKQCITVINSKHEKEVWISCYCKEPTIKMEYKYSIIQMDDGGKCNVHPKINLTKRNYSEFNISG